jgi:hypothetical protein
VRVIGGRKISKKAKISGKAAPVVESDLVVSRSWDFDSGELTDRYAKKI